jgi:hypothetical protein
VVEYSLISIEKPEELLQLLESAAQRLPSTSWIILLSYGAREPQSTGSGEIVTQCRQILGGNPSVVI